MDNLQRPEKELIFYEDKKLYATLASYPLTKGHVVVVWKNNVSDLHLLKRKDYEHLMNVVDKVRDKMLRVLKIKKIYLIYMDEAKHVHWHLIPRYNEKGFNVLMHKPKKIGGEDSVLVKKIKKSLSFKIKNY